MWRTMTRSARDPWNLYRLKIGFLSRTSALVGEVIS
jgi:hypothetical protein